MPTEAISRHDFFTDVAFMVRVKEIPFNPNRFQQRSTSAADRQADRQHSCERSNPTQPRWSSDPGLVSDQIKAQTLDVA